MRDERRRQYVRFIVGSIYKGLILFLLSMCAIVVRDQKNLYAEILSANINFQDVFPVFTLFFSAIYLWYYTWKGSSIMIRRLQIWIGYTRAVIVTSTVAIILQYF